MSCSRAAQRDRLVEHLQGVGVDVLVLPVLVGSHPQRRQFRQHDVGQAGVHQHLQPPARIAARHQLGELGLHPLDGDPGQLTGHLGDRRGHRLGGRDAQLGDEPGCP
jgi:hypothetical protein